MSPGLNAAVGFRKPPPMSKFVAADRRLLSSWALMAVPSLPVRVAVVTMAEWMAATLHDGNFCLSNATTPDTCGAAILVPDRVAKLDTAHSQHRQTTIESISRSVQTIDR